MLTTAAKVARSLSSKDTYPTCPESFGAEDTDGSSRSLGSTAGSNRSGPGGKSRSKSPRPSKVKTLDPSTTNWATSREPSLFGGLLSEDGGKLAKIDDAEQEAREYAHHNVWYVFFASTYASLKVFAAYLITLNSIFGVLLTVGATLVVYFSTEPDAAYLGTMDVSVCNGLLCVAFFVIYKKSQLICACNDISTSTNAVGSTRFCRSASTFGNCSVCFRPSRSVPAIHYGDEEQCSTYISSSCHLGLVRWKR